MAAYVPACTHDHVGLLWWPLDHQIRTGTRLDTDLSEWRAASHYPQLQSRSSIYTVSDLVTSPWSNYIQLGSVNYINFITVWKYLFCPTPQPPKEMSTVHVYVVTGAGGELHATWPYRHFLWKIESACSFSLDSFTFPWTPFLPSNSDSTFHSSESTPWGLRIAQTTALTASTGALDSHAPGTSSLGSLRVRRTHPNISKTTRKMRARNANILHASGFGFGRKYVSEWE